VMFNPNSYGIDKTVAYDVARDSDGNPLKSDRKANAPTRTFGGGGGRSISMELFFDTTEQFEDKPKPQLSKSAKFWAAVKTGAVAAAGAGGTAAAEAAGTAGIPATAAANALAGTYAQKPDDGDTHKDVRDSDLQRLVKLSEIERSDKHTAPAVGLTWGGKDIVTGGNDIAFIGVLTSLGVRFTLFAGDGRPLRALVTVRFEELLDREADERKTDPEFTTRILRRGDSLAAIAAEQYGDAAAWRAIAQANALDDPRTLPVGQALALPKAV
jgi:nucleoid-associated protein YgaU